MILSIVLFVRSPKGRQCFENVREAIVVKTIGDMRLSSAFIGNLSLFFSKSLSRVLGTMVEFSRKTVMRKEKEIDLFVREAPQRKRITYIMRASLSPNPECQNQKSSDILLWTISNWRQCLFGLALKGVVCNVVLKSLSKSLQQQIF